MKIFYKLDSGSDWIAATEVFSREELRDREGVKIPIGSTSNFNTILFKKPLICSQFKIMMNQPVKKKSFSLEVVRFYQRINKVIIKTSIGHKKLCWYMNTDIPRIEKNLLTYPCIKTVFYSTGNELFQLTTNRMIKSINTGNCVGYNEYTKDIVLKTCEEGPWKLDRSRVKLIKDLIERYNLDSEGKPKCSGNHEMKRFDAPLANGYGEGGL